MLRVLPIAVLSTVVLIFLTIIVHELAHLVAAFILGIPILNFSWFDPAHLAPAITFRTTENSIGLAVIQYSGGLVTGALLLTAYVAYFVSNKYAERGPAWWLIGLVIALLAFWQIGQGMIEGCLHQIYLLEAARLGSLSFAMQCLFIVTGFAVHLWQTRLWRKRQS